MFLHRHGSCPHEPQIALFLINVKFSSLISFKKRKLFLKQKIFYQNGSWGHESRLR